MVTRTLTVKGMPNELYKRLKQSATAHRRSLNREAIVQLERSLQSRHVDPSAFLARSDALRQRVAAPPITEELLRRAKAEGRP